MARQSLLRTPHCASALLRSSPLNSADRRLGVTSCRAKRHQEWSDVHVQFMVLPMAKHRLVGVTVLLVWCVGLLTYRSYLTTHSFTGGDKSSLGMVWNLFLAVVPLLWGVAYEAADARKCPALAAVFFLLWLLFLPNAPYLFTDLIHLHSSPDVPLWYLLATLMSCAGTGTLIGYLSLLHVQTIIEQKYGRKIGWVVAGGALMLCGFGIYLGRCLHWNSWDIFVHPFQLIRTVSGQVINPSAQPNPLAVTLVFGIGLIIGYVGVRVFSPFNRASDNAPPLISP